ncbi:MAG: TonB-dependent receptor [Prevotella sp.]|nr:TonB-dependent receptor [Prevotella sp.]
MKHFKYLMVLLALLVSSSIYAQKQNFTGKVLDANGEPVIGATVMVKGTTNGTATDLDGNFTIAVDPGATLTISYVGYTTQEMRAANNMTVTLKEDAKMLNDVVVIGYGTQKKSVVTAAIAKVDAADMANKSIVRMDNALKGLAAGVNVTSSSGQPGAAARIRVRGTGTINNSDPLYIVDGMPIEGGLDYVNPSDIESIEVLKDAASGAIYGARAANGVILVTTKKGKKGRANVNYNFSYGWQSAWKHRDVLNATDYAILQNEQHTNSGQPAPYADPYALGAGTDWQNLVFNDNAPVVNHELSVSGASDKLNYYLSMGYYTQDGIVGGNYGQSNYQRLTLRSNTTYNLFDDTAERNWLNKLDLTANLSYARVKSAGIATNSQWGSVLGSALALSPVLTPTVSGQAAIDQNSRYVYQTYGTDRMIDHYYDPILDRNGEVLMIPGPSYNEMNNPLSLLALPAAKNWSHKFVANFAAELNLWDALKYRFSYSADMSFWGNDSYTPQTYYRSSNNLAQYTSAYSDSERGTVWQVENTLSYDKTLGKHHFSIVVGQSAFRNTGFGLNGSRRNLINPDKPSINYANGSYQTTYQVIEKGNDKGKFVPVYILNDKGEYVQAGYQVTGAVVESAVAGWIGNPHSMSSLFFRGSYDYDERYMAQFTIRRDGSSRFGKNHKYGTFPSVSLGWNVMNEAFMENTRDWLSNFKVRFSWGKNGNDNIGDFRYTVLTATGNNYYFGTNSTLTQGSKASGLPNPDLKWEESEQTDLGVDLGFLNNSLTLGIDYFSKRTNGMLMEMGIPSYIGEAKPVGNVGDMENSGVEFELGYKWHVGDAHFNVKGNASYLHNKLLKYGNEKGFQDLDSFQGAGTITRAQNGLPFPFFYGFKTAGIFQNMNEVQSYTNADGGMIQPNAVPGDVRFVDMNGDGKINNDDRTNIGNGTPKWTFGLNFNAEWKGFDFNMFWQGVTGVDVFDATRRTDIASSNYPSWMLQRWTGEGTSNRIPRLSNGDANNWQSSDLYIYDGAYLRLKNISLGYTLPQNLTQRFFVQRLRVFVMAENLITWTKYHGFDPEISSGGTSLGVDYGVYPQARTWTLGFNITL